MSTFFAACRCLALVALALFPALAGADDWPAPVAKTTESANGRYRVSVLPRLSTEPGAGQRPVHPLARVERLVSPGHWQLVWQRPLVNEVAPVSALLADDASYLVTFDNWHAVGYGEDVVVIYDRRGELVRKLSLEQILSPERLRQVPMSVSSRWWGGKHRLVQGDLVVELQVVEPRPDATSTPTYSAIRIRLSDGVLLPGR